MRYLLLSFMAFATLTICSCKKDKDQGTPPKNNSPVTYADLTHLKQGNYWIYQLYEIDSNGESGTPLPLFDSVYAGPDTVFDGLQYHTRMVPTGNLPETYRMELHRDSLGYIMSGSKAYASSTDFTNVLYEVYSLMYDDTVALVQVQMTDKNVTTTVPAGSFTTVTRSQQWHMFPKYRAAGTIRKQNTCFSAAAGIISETMPFYFDRPTMRQRRLIRYHVQ